jgi:hypothetical protein
MTYPPTGGYDPQQSAQPPYQPSDPYRQGQPSGYGAPTPPGFPGMTPPVNVQPGYSVPPSGMPYGQPPLPPQQPGQSNSLVITLGVIVGLVLLLGIAALLIVPGLLDDGDTVEANREPTVAASVEPTEDESDADTDADAEGSGDSGGGDEQRGWSDFVAFGKAEPGSPEDVVMRWETAYDLAKPDEMEELICSDPGWLLESYLDLAAERDPYEFSSTYYAASRDVYGERQVALTYSYGGVPSHDEISSGYVVVEEGGEWKVCDTAYF